MNTNNTAVGNCIVGMAVWKAAIFGKAAHSGAGRLPTWEAATSSQFPGPAGGGLVTGPVIFPVQYLSWFSVFQSVLDVPWRERQPRRHCFQLLVQCFFLPTSKFSSSFLQRKLEISKEKGENARLPFCQYYDLIS
jgi:hypothetical protein